MNVRPPSPGPVNPAPSQINPAPSTNTPAPAQAIPGEYIVGFTRESTPDQRAAALASFTPLQQEPLGLIDGALVKVAPAQVISPGELPPALSGVVAFIQPNYLHQVRDAAPVNDPQFVKQYALRNTGQTGGRPGADVKAIEAWKLSTGRGVVVAVADTNVDITHPDIAGNVWKNPGEIAGNRVDDDRNGFVDDINGWNFGTNSPDVARGGQSHGTHVAGIIGATANNGVGIAGIAPDVRIMPVPVLTSSASTANAIKAFEYAAKNGAHIISNSWGNNTYEPALQAAVTAATNAGLMVVVAAGNENWDTGINGSYPDNYAGSVSIAASDHKDAKASYSNRGTITIDVAAPGDAILSTVPGARYANMSGTSMAAPAYSAVAALVKSAYPHLSMREVEERIFRSVQRDGSAGSWKPLVASGGRIDAARALMPIATPVQPAPAAGALPQVGTPVQVAWGADILSGQRFDVSVSTNPQAVSRVNEQFEGSAPQRGFRTVGQSAWGIATGAGRAGSGAMSAPPLADNTRSILELTETLSKPAEVSFWYRASRGSELSFFVNRNLQFQPTTSDGWQRFSAVLPAGEHTLTWLASGNGSSSAAPAAIDDLVIGEVSDATWKPVGTSEPGATTLTWTPDAPAGAAQIRVRASNGAWFGDWVSGPMFSVQQR
jgi:subtilisin family serine protease